MSRRPVYAVVVALLGALLGIIVAGNAVAADPVTVGISEVKGDESTVTGIFTLRSKSSVRVDPPSVVATLDGTKAPVMITQAPRLERRAMLVIDTSGSMGPAGMATVRTATAKYLREVPADVAVGVATFADTAGVDLPPTTERAPAQRVVDGLVSRGDTSLYAGMQSAVAALGTKGDRSIVLLSDGADTLAPDKPAALKKVVDTLKKSGVRTDVVQFKTKDSDAVTALRAFAAANGGSVVPAGDTAAVTAAFQESAMALDAQVQFAVTAPAPLTGPHLMTINGTAGGTPFAFTRTVEFGAAAVPPALPSDAASAPSSAQALDGLGVPKLTVPTDQPWLLWVAVLLIALGLLSGLLALTAPALKSRKRRRVESIESYVAVPGTTSRSTAKAQPTAATRQLIELGELIMAGRKSAKGTMALIERADLPFRAGEWFVIELVAGIVGAALGTLLFRDGGGPGLAFGLAAGGLLGLCGPTLVLRVLANRRAKAFERVLPDVLSLVATSLRSGFGLTQALDAVARDAAEPAAKEFSRALAQTRIGAEITDALERMAERMDSTSMRWAVMAMRIQRDVGGNLADTLRTTAVTLRERQSLHRQVQTLSAEGRLSAYILIALPVGLFLYMMSVNREYISQLWTEPIGLLMLAVAAVELVVGILWMRRVVRIEV